MQIEVLDIVVTELRIGDEWHMDEYSVDGTKRIIKSDIGRVWRVISSPFESVNNQLFWDNIKSECIVVPVEYHDGARGSRLFDPDQKLLIRRDTSQKGA